MEEYIVKDTSKIQLQSVINFMGALGYTYLMPTKSFESGWWENRSKQWISLSTAIALHNGSYKNWATGRFKKPFNNISAGLYGAAQEAKIVEIAKLQHSRKKGIITQDHRVTFVIPENAEVLLKK